MRHLAIAMMTMLIGTAAHAQALRDFCTDRPGLGTPPCVVDVGHVMVELGIGGWSHDKQPDTTTDTVMAGELLARLGVTPTTELRFGWDAYGHVRERDRADGSVERMSGTGDVTLGVLQSLRNPNGKGVSIGIIPQVTLPAGGKAIGAGTWGAALLVPVSVGVGDTFRILMTPEVEARPDGDRHGRHLAYSDVVALQSKLGKKNNLTAEIQATRDNDPDGHQTQLLAALSLDYRPTKRYELDAQVVAGLNRNSPDVALMFGMSRKF